MRTTARMRGRVSGERIECANKLKDKFSVEFEDDPKLLRIMREGKSVAVFYVSTAENVTIEKVSE
jgi:hypothetical protein